MTSTPNASGESQLAITAWADAICAALSPEERADLLANLCARPDAIMTMSFAARLIRAARLGAHPTTPTARRRSSAPVGAP